MLPLTQQEFYPLYCCTVSLYKKKGQQNYAQTTRLCTVNPRLNILYIFLLEYFDLN